jgi:hypothetical protein
VGCRRPLLAALGAGALLLASGPALSAPRVFFDPQFAPGGVTPPQQYEQSMLQGSQASFEVPLVFDPAPFTPGTGCNPVSPGVCGIDFHVQVRPGVTIQSFVFNDAFVPNTGNRQQSIGLEPCASDVADPATPAAECSTLRVNAITAANPIGASGRVGSLFLDSSGTARAGGIGRVTLVQDVEPSALDLRTGGPEDIILIPAPGRWLLLASGLVGLSGLHALRERRRRW